jgi:hypothetical protein
MAGAPPLPEHPELRAIAEALEMAEISGEILDDRWRLVYISSEEARIIGVEPAEVGRFYGKGLPRRQLEDGEYYATTDGSSRDWWKLNVPMMRAFLDPADPAFTEVFGDLSKAAARVEPGSTPRAWASVHSFPDLEARLPPGAHGAGRPGDAPADGRHPIAGPTVGEHPLRRPRVLG